jgi:hypothetical protein
MITFEVVQAPIDRRGHELPEIPLAVLGRNESVTAFDFSPSLPIADEESAVSGTDKYRLINIRNVGSAAVISSLAETYAQLPEQYWGEYLQELGVVSAKHRAWSERILSASSMFVNLRVRYLG